MNYTEQLIGKTFEPYRVAQKAHLFFLYPAMRAVGQHGKLPCFIQTAKAPYDVAGFYWNKCATAVGLEIKETHDHENTLPIVHPDKRGNGLQYHQLKALVELHESGGTAIVLWNNGGELGILTGQALALVKFGYDASLRVEKQGKTPAKGTRSIPWGQFTLVQGGYNGLPLWLPPAPDCVVKKGKQ